MTDPHERSRQRRDDYDTSASGAGDVSRRAPNQRMMLLQVWSSAGVKGLTDEEAAEAAGLLEINSCYWKRSGELRSSGYIEWHPRGFTRVGLAGTSRKVSLITEAGRALLSGGGAAVPVS